MYSIGIIPAGGHAKRFGSIPKELLPLPDGCTLLGHAIMRLSFCDKVVIVSNDEKIALHREIVGERAEVVKQSGNEMYGAWITACEHSPADNYYMTMPDTYMPDDVFDGVEPATFSMGLFETNEPERFGVFANGNVIDKPTNAPVPSLAWGALQWSYATFMRWQEHDCKTYTQAINDVLTGIFSTWNIKYYYDCANTIQYLKLLDEMRRA